MIGHKYCYNAYSDLDLPMNVMSRFHYNAISSRELEYKRVNFVGSSNDVHVFVGNLTYLVDFTILEDIEAIIDPRSLSHVVLGRPFVETTNLI